MKQIQENKELFEELYDNDDLLREKLGIVQHVRHVTNYHERIATEDNNTNSKEAKTFIKRIAHEKELREKEKAMKLKAMDDKLLKDQVDQEQKKEEEKKKME